MLRSTPSAPSPRSKVISLEDEASGERYRNPQVQALYKSVLDSLAAEHPELDHILSRLRKAPKDLREQAIKELAPDIGKLIFAALSSSGGAKSRSKR
jgi:hypothetical protein